MVGGLRLGLGLGVGGHHGGDFIAPSITSGASASVAENATLAHSLTSNETVTWSIVGGADQAQFQISGSTLRWSANGTRNFEAPADANTDNAYVVDVRATDTVGNTTDQTVTITVTNALEVTLAALSLDDLTIAEDQTTGTKVGTITGASSGSTVTLLTQSNANMFAKDGNDIEVGATALDFETVPSPTITLRETHADASNSPRDTVVTITVTDVAEGGGLGPNLVTNGTFDSATDWDWNEGGSISGGTANVTALGSPDGDQLASSQVVNLSPGTEYRLTWTITTISSGSVTPYHGDFPLELGQTTPGTYSLDFTAGASDNSVAFIFEAATTASIDDVMIQEIL